MLSKSFIAIVFLLASISSTNAHAGVTPALGVKGQFTRNDVQRPSANSPCGNINIPQNLDASTPVQADANGNFNPSITDFNGGADGSRSVQKVQVDASGTGKNFVPAKVTTNGDANPANVGTQQLTVQLPPGTKCAGGANKNLCLASFTTTAGFGNCAVVSQGAGAPKARSPSDLPGQSTPPVNGAAKGVSRPANANAANGTQANPDKNGKDDKKGQSDKAQSDKKGQNDKKGANSEAGKANDGKANDDKKKKDDKKGQNDKKGANLEAGKAKDDKKKNGDQKGQDDKNGQNDKKGANLEAGKAKGDKKKKGDKKGQDKKKGKNLAAGEAKDDKKKNDGKKNDGKKKNGKKNKDKGKQADKNQGGAKNSAAPAQGSNSKRSWSSRPLANLA